MATILQTPFTAGTLRGSNLITNKWRSSLTIRGQYRRVHRIRAFFFNPTEEPILKEALKEPVAFMGGMFAGILRLDLNDDPLKEWVKRTVEVSGPTVEETDVQEPKTETDEIPQQIEIE